jgi:glycosyltransferase involved in cell wall biosynthesis
MTKSDFAVIVPAYNEAPVIKDLVRELSEAFERHGLDGEVVLVDDVMLGESQENGRDQVT